MNPKPNKIDSTEGRGEYRDNEPAYATDEIYISNSFLEELAFDISELRDADFHVCKYDELQEKGEEPMNNNLCTCRHFDSVIDKIEKQIKKESK